MIQVIASAKQELSIICQRRNVRRLAVFGSATGDHFDAATSDLDFVVDFAPMTPRQHADSFFGLNDDLAALFQRPVDLIEWAPIRNPIFRQSVLATQIPLFDAA
jgi:uncharacterized protein